MSENKIKDGGPAFPGHGSVGISVRDYFAAKIFPEVYRQYADQANAKNKWDPEWEMYLAVDTYRMADAMLRAREHSIPK